MTRIAPIGPGAGPPRRPARGGGFALAAGAPPPADGSAAVVAPSLLLLQEAGPATPDPARAARRAAAALDELRGLQLELLSGAADPARLARLAALVDGAESSGDPELKAALKAVALRARLEMVRRRGHFASSA
jgi:hypothetical protein